MRYGYHCDDCGTGVAPTTTRTELVWLKHRLHVVREVARHSSGGLDSWMAEGLAFLETHDGHAVTIAALEKHR
ncbi:MAG: hypothetical protein ACYDA5_11360 [Vulcanimicrobiaceae bacterium]